MSTVCQKQQTQAALVHQSHSPIYNQHKYTYFNTDPKDWTVNIFQCFVWQNKLIRDDAVNPCAINKVKISKAMLWQQTALEDVFIGI